MGTKILIVDDTLEAVQLLSLMLETNGFESVTSLTSEKAIRLAKEQAPAAALVDLLIPDLDGLEICRRLRADPETADMGLIIVTAVNEPDVAARVEAAGADALIYKPVDMNDLVNTLKEVLSARGLG